MPTTAKTIRAIDRLRKAANLEPTKKKLHYLMEQYLKCDNTLTLAEKEEHRE